MVKSLSTIADNIINHVVIVMDESWSMYGHRQSVVKVTDNQVKWLADHSKLVDQETRITVYVFSSRGTPRCLIYDMDVLRVPSIANLYNPRGNTALRDAVHLAIDDLKKIPQKYGNHSFLIYVVTDGLENDSVTINSAAFREELKDLDDNWTLGVFVPNSSGVYAAKLLGFAPGNISVWSTTDEHGVEDVGSVMQTSTSNYMTSRSMGVRGTRSLFEVSANPTEVTKALVPLTKGSYYFLDVKIESGMPVTTSYAAKGMRAVQIDEFVRFVTGKVYNPGKFFYQFTKPETIQGDKLVAVEVGDEVYTGQAARDYLKLPSYEVRVKPGDHKGCTIFVQSRAFNRKVIEGTRVLALR